MFLFSHLQSYISHSSQCTWQISSPVQYANNLNTLGSRSIKNHVVAEPTTQCPEPQLRMFGMRERLTQ